MTVNERLSDAGLLEQFDIAARARDRARLVELLVRAELSREQAEDTVRALLAHPRRYGY
jgi:hypothetical protein